MSLADFNDLPPPLGFMLRAISYRARHVQFDAVKSWQFSKNLFATLVVKAFLFRRNVKFLFFKKLLQLFLSYHHFCWTLRVLDIHVQRWQIEVGFSACCKKKLCIFFLQESCGVFCFQSPRTSSNKGAWWHYLGSQKSVSLRTLNN